MNKKFSLSSPYLFGNEKKYLNECIDSNWLTSSGKFVKLFEQKIKKLTKAKYVISCVNGTSALQVGLRVLGVKKNDEVIVPTLTFIASVNSIIYNNAKPIFVDVDSNFSIDPIKFQDFIKNNTYMKNGSCFNIRTKNKISALIVVHVWGNAANLYLIRKICKNKNIKLIEDASESLGTIYSQGNFKNLHTGTIGDLGVVSFNGNKILTTGGGGALLINNKKISEKARYLLNQAKDDSILYKHNEVGYNFTMSNVHAAIGVAQIEKFDKILLKKNNIRKWYEYYLGEENLYPLPKYALNNCWFNILKLKKPHSQPMLVSMIQKLSKKNIEVRPIWQLNHTQRMFKNYEKYKIKNAIFLYKNSICLPSSANLKKNDIKFIVSNI